MQRKDNLLRVAKLNKIILGSTLSVREDYSIKDIAYTQAKRKGFAMITAIVMMIIVATITMFTLMQTGQSVKKTADMYLYEQAELHTKSAIEYTLFEIARVGCQATPLSFTLDSIYDVNVTARYSYVGGAPIGCTSFATVNTNQQDGSVLMDISINVSSLHSGSDPIRYFRRTIQKL